MKMQYLSVFLISFLQLRRFFDFSEPSRNFSKQVYFVKKRYFATASLQNSSLSCLKIDFWYDIIVLSKSSNKERAYGFQHQASAFEKKAGFTQDGLSLKLGVSRQAISKREIAAKWEELNAS